MNARVVVLPARPLLDCPGWCTDHTNDPGDDIEPPMAVHRHKLGKVAGMAVLLERYDFTGTNGRRSAATN
jgi:hypothetical protein